MLEATNILTSYNFTTTCDVAYLNCDALTCRHAGFLSSAIGYGCRDKRENEPFIHGHRPKLMCARSFFFSDSHPHDLTPDQPTNTAMANKYNHVPRTL